MCTTGHVPYRVSALSGMCTTERMTVVYCAIPVGHHTTWSIIHPSLVFCTPYRGCTKEKPEHNLHAQEEIKKADQKKKMRLFFGGRVEIFRRPTPNEKKRTVQTERQVSKHEAVTITNGKWRYDRTCPASDAPSGLLATTDVPSSSYTKPNTAESTISLGELLVADTVTWKRREETEKKKRREKTMTHKRTQIIASFPKR